MKKANTPKVLHIQTGFYMVQPMPAVPEHIKLGWTANLERRLKQYRCLCPEVQVIGWWPYVSPDAEKYIMQCVESRGYKRIGTEVFLAPDPDKLKEIIGTLIHATKSWYPRNKRESRQLSSDMSYKQADRNKPDTVKSGGHVR